MMDILSENYKKEYPKSVTELLRLEEKRFMQGVCYFIDAYAHVQSLVSVVKWLPCLSVYYRRASFCFAFFCGQKNSMKKNIHKEMFSVYGGKCLSHKAVHKWVEKCGKRFADDEEVEMEVWKWLRQQSKDCGFRRTGKATG
jgi:hypothetical protein